MNINNPAYTYAFMIIPTLFALTVVGHGIQLLIHDDKEGQVALVFGLFLLFLIVVGYFMFVKI